MRRSLFQKFLNLDEKSQLPLRRKGYSLSAEEKF